MKMEIKNGKVKIYDDRETGVILNWKIGTVADVHFKVCDDGKYHLLDENDNIVSSIIDDYVPKILDIHGESYGDYIIMKIDENGFIEKWNKKASLKCFESK